MSAITLRIPDDKHQRLKNLAEQRGVSINQLLNDVTTSLLTDFDAEVRFRVRAERGSGKTERGIELLQKAMGN